MSKTAFSILQRPVATAICLLLIAGIVLFFRLGASPVYILDEAKNAQCAREMMTRNDWIVPTFNNELRPHKPPLHYYFMWASYKVFGTTAFGARFPSALFGLLTLASGWWFVKRFTSARIALFTLLTMVLSTHFLFEFRLAVPDPYLIFFTSVSLFSFFAFIQEQKSRWIIFSAIFMALAVLSKGPVAVALPGLSILIWLLLQRKLHQLINWKFLVAVVFFLIIAVPWYVLVHKATDGAFTRGFFLEHNIQRFAEPMEGHGGIFLLVPLFVLVGLLPLSVFLIGFISNFRSFMNEPMVSFSAVIGIVFVLFFSFSGTKLPNYPMPCYPFISLLIAYSINNAIELKLQHKASWYLLLVLTLLLFAAALVGFHIDATLRPLSNWAFIFLIPVVGVAVSIYFPRRNVEYAFVAVTLGYCIFNLAGLGVLYPAIYDKNPVSLSMAVIKSSKKVYGYHLYNPAFNFYLDQHVTMLYTRPEVEEVFKSDKAAVLITRENYLTELQGLPLKIVGQYKDPLETPVTTILKHR